MYSGFVLKNASKELTKRIFLELKTPLNAGFEKQKLKVLYYFEQRLIGELSTSNFNLSSFFSRQGDFEMQDIGIGWAKHSRLDFYVVSHLIKELLPVKNNYS